MRLKSEIWVKWYLRQAANAGGMGAVVRHGDDTAGAIFIKINRLNGLIELYGPAPPALDAGDDGERRFQRLNANKPMTEAEAEAYLEREARFDSDLWVLEIESSGGAHFLDGWLLATPG